MEQEAGSAYVVTNTDLDRETRANYTLDVSNIFLFAEAQTATRYQCKGYPAVFVAVVYSPYAGTVWCQGKLIEVVKQILGARKQCPLVGAQ